MNEREPCKHERWTGWANNIGGTDYHCDNCGALIQRTGTQYPPQYLRQMADGSYLIADGLVRSEWDA